LEAKIAVTDRDVADAIARAEPEKARQAFKLASELERVQTQLQYTINYRRDSNYDYWETRCKFEQTPNALSARELMYRAKNAFQDGDVTTAKSLYQQGFAKWRLVIDEFPAILVDEATTGDDLIDYIKGYHEVLELLNEQLGDDFPLWDVIEKFDRDQQFTDELNRHQHQHKGTPEEANVPAATPSAASDAPEEGSATSDPTGEKPETSSPPASENAEQQAVPASTDAPAAQ
jgi:hypothetical protein